MKRLMPSSLITFLQNNPNCLKADLFVLTLPTGTTTYVTEGQWDITVKSGTNGWSFGTHTFSSTQYGRWSRGAITSEAGFNLSANSMTLTCIAQQGTAYPGLSVGILSAAFNGLFDTATVGVYTCYMPLGGYGNVSAGIETKFVGFIEKATDINRTSVTFEVQDPLYLFNEQVPKRLIQPNCPWSFGDGNCNIAGGIAAFTQAFTAGAGSNQTTLVPSSAFSEAAGYFTQGVVKCTAGQNAGLTQTVKLHAGGNLQMTQPWFLPVSIGDSFSAVAGCDKSVTACKGRKNTSGTAVDNSSHFGAMIDVPVPSTAL